MVDILKGALIATFIFPALAALAQQQDGKLEGSLRYAPPHLQPVFEFQERKPPRYVTTPDGHGWFILQRADSSPAKP